VTTEERLLSTNT
jgi:hypothetical protein